jgi:hypothetical protein
MLMCLRHWRKVPDDIKDDIWKHYRRGQEIDRKPSIDYLAAALSAVHAVANTECLECDTTITSVKIIISLCSSKFIATLQNEASNAN